MKPKSDLIKMIEASAKAEEEGKSEELLAQNIKELLQKAYFISIDMELFKKVKTDLDKKYDLAKHGSVLCYAFGINAEKKEQELVSMIKRYEAIINLIEVIKETDKERVEMEEQEKEIESNKKKLESMFK